MSGILDQLTAAAAVAIKRPARRDRYRSTIAQPAAVIAWMLTLEKRLITAAAAAARMAAKMQARLMRGASPRIMIAVKRSSPPPATK